MGAGFLEAWTCFPRSPFQKPLLRFQVHAQRSSPFYLGFHCVSHSPLIQASPAKRKRATRIPPPKNKKQGSFYMTPKTMFPNVSVCLYSTMFFPVLLPRFLPVYVSLCFHVFPMFHMFPCSPLCFPMFLKCYLPNSPRGAAADHYGRRPLLIFSFLASKVSVRSESSCRMRSGRVS